MNSLSKKALGEILLIINDDIILDHKSIDYAINELINIDQISTEFLTNTWGNIFFTAKDLNDDLDLDTFPPIKEPNSIPNGPPKEKPIIPPIKLPQIDI